MFAPLLAKTNMMSCWFPFGLLLAATQHPEKTRLSRAPGLAPEPAPRETSSWNHLKKGRQASEMELEPPDSDSFQGTPLLKIGESPREKVNQGPLASLFSPKPEAASSPNVPPATFWVPFQ